MRNKTFLTLSMGALTAQTYTKIHYYLNSFFFLSVPMDLDVKMKAVMIGAVFLIVSSTKYSHGLD